MIRIILALGLFVGGVASAQAEDCNIPYFKLIPDVEVTGHMYVKAGKSCSVQSVNGDGGNIDIVLRRRPANGQVQIVSPFRITYKPRPGFVGKDSFSYVRHARDYSNKSFALPVNMDVTVNP